MATITRCTRRDMHLAVAGLEEFIYNKSATGTWTIGGHVRTGQLSHDMRRSLETFIADRNQGVYVVYSYETPIAVYLPNKGWWINSNKYSPTTSNHQSMTNRGIDLRDRI